MASYYATKELLVIVLYTIPSGKAARQQGNCKAKGFSEAFVAVQKNKPKFCLWAETSQNTSADWSESESWQEPRATGS